MNPNYPDNYGYAGYGNDGRSNSPQVAYDRKHGSATPVNYQPYNTNLAPQNQQQQHNPYANPQQQPPMQFYNPLSNPVAASIAAQYGANLADQGKEYLAQNVSFKSFLLMMITIRVELAIFSFVSSFRSTAGSPFPSCATTLPSTPTTWPRSSQSFSFLISIE